MAKRKVQFRKQQIATVGHSDKFSRRMKALGNKDGVSKGKKQPKSIKEVIKDGEQTI